jgi:PPP family 3-phenylpropionic acid transporter
MEALPLTLMALLFVAGIVAFWLPAREVHELAPQAGAFGQALKEPRVRRFLLASCFMLLAHAPLYTLFSLWLEQQGYSRTEIGVLWTVGVLAEIAFFRVQRPLFERLGVVMSWRLSYGVAALRFALLALSGGNLAVIVITQLMHSITFGAHHSASMSLVRQWFPRQAQARGQALYTMSSYGIGGSLGGIAAGWVFEWVSPEATFFMAAGFALVGLFLASVGDDRKA